jgi:hypothetical protein
MRMQAMLMAMVGRVREEVMMLERWYSVDMLDSLGGERSGVVRPKGALRRRFERFGDGRSLVPGEMDLPSLRRSKPTPPVGWRRNISISS